MRVSTSDWTIQHFLRHWINYSLFCTSFELILHGRFVNFLAVEYTSICLFGQLDAYQFLQKIHIPFSILQIASLCQPWKSSSFEIQIHFFYTRLFAKLISQKHGNSCFLFFIAKSENRISDLNNCFLKRNIRTISKKITCFTWFSKSIRLKLKAIVFWL